MLYGRMRMRLRTGLTVIIMVIGTILEDGILCHAEEAAM